MNFCLLGHLKTVAFFVVWNDCRFHSAVLWCANIIKLVHNHIASINNIPEMKTLTEEEQKWIESWQ